MATVSTGQFLTDKYAKTLSETQIRNLENNNLIKKDKATGQYELTNKGIEVFKTADSSKVSRPGESIFVADTVGVKLTGKKQQPKTEGTKTEKTFTLSSLYERLAISGGNNKELQTKFLTQLKSIQGVTVNDNGEFSYTAEAKANIQTLINSFCEENKNMYTDNKKAGVSTGDETMDKNLVEAGVLQQDENGNTVVSAEYKDKIKLNGGEPVKSGTTNGVLNGTESTTTTEVTNADKLEPTGTLRGNKQLAKEFTATMKEQYAKWLDNDPTNQYAADFYVADTKYHDKVEARIKELSQSKTEASGEYANGKKFNISKDYNITAGEIFDMFLKRSGSEDEQKNLLANLTELANSDKPEDIKKFEDVLKPYYGDGMPKELSEQDRMLAAKIIFIQDKDKGMGLKPSELLRLMAMEDVMRDRTPEQVEKDNKYFIDHQSKDYVRNKQAEQDYNNTTVHMSGKARKSADKDGRIHTDIGSRGRALVHMSPQTFCSEVTEADYKRAQATGNAEEYFAEKITYYEEKTAPNGKKYKEKATRTAYYKFESDKYKSFMKLACDPSAGLDPTNKEKLEDLNMTLQEGRDGLELCAMTKDGELVPIVNLLGNNNGKVDNSELNAWRHMAEKAGLSVDSNPTYLKRLGQFAKDLAITVGSTVAVPALGNLIGGIASLANSTATQFISNDPVSITTPDKYVTHPDQWVQGQPTDWIHEVFDADGNDLSASFHADGEKIFVPGKTYKINGETYTAKVPDTKVDGQNPGVNLLKTGVVATVGFAAGWLAGKRGNIHAVGRHNDDIYKPVIYGSKSSEKDVTDSFEFPQYSNQYRLDISTEFGGFAIDDEKRKARGLTMEQYKTNNPKNRAQAVICNMGAGSIGENNSLKRPDVINFPDTTNGERKYEYRRLTDTEIEEQELDKNNGPYYKLVDITKTEKGKEKKIKGSHLEVYRLDKVDIVPVQQEDGTVTLQISYDLGQYKGMAGSNRTSVNNNKEIQPWW